MIVAIPSYFLLMQDVIKYHMKYPKQNIDATLKIGRSLLTATMANANEYNNRRPYSANPTRPKKSNCIITIVPMEKRKNNRVFVKKLLGKDKELNSFIFSSYSV